MNGSERLGIPSIGGAGCKLGIASDQCKGAADSAIIMHENESTHISGLATWLNNTAHAYQRKQWEIQRVQGPCSHSQSYLLPVYNKQDHHTPCIIVPSTLDHYK